MQFCSRCKMQIVVGSPTCSKNGTQLLTESARLQDEPLNTGFDR